jgi:hypothetical protein
MQRSTILLDDIVAQNSGKQSKQEINWSERLSIDRQRAQNEAMKLEHDRKVFEMAMRNNSRN